MTAYCALWPPRRRAPRSCWRRPPSASPVTRGGRGRCSAGGGTGFGGNCIPHPIPKRTDQHPAQDGRCQEAPAHKDDALIVRAGQPTFWYGKDLSPLNIALDPAFLQRVALETCGSDPGRIELCDVFSTRDPTLARLAWLCCPELQTGGLGGPAYLEALGILLAVHLLRGV